MKLVLVFAFIGVVFGMPPNQNDHSLAGGQDPVEEDPAPVFVDDYVYLTEDTSKCNPKDYVAEEHEHDNDTCTATCSKLGNEQQYNLGFFKPGQPPKCHCYCLHFRRYALIDEESNHTAKPEPTTHDTDTPGEHTTASHGNTTTPKKSSGVEVESLGILSILCSLGAYVAYITTLFLS